MRTINYTAPEPKLFVEYQGQRMALRDVAKLVGIEVRTLRSRLSRWRARRTTVAAARL